MDCLSEQTISLLKFSVETFFETIEKHVKRTFISDSQAAVLNKDSGQPGKTLESYIKKKKEQQ